MNKINIDNQKEAHFQKVSQEVDFQAFMKNKTLTSNKKTDVSGFGKWIMGSILVAVTAVGIWKLLENNELQQSQKHTHVPYTFQANSAADDTPFEVYSVDLLPDQALDVKTKEGSNIHIPANSLVNETGELVYGKVDFLYRSFHDLPSIFLSGIPMNYDSMGQRYAFESAGMFELYAQKEGVHLFVDSSKALQVSLSSSHPGNYMNQYYLNPKTQAWEFLQKDTVGKNSLESVRAERIYASQAYAQQMDSLEQAKPLIIPALIEEKPYIQLAFDARHYPELRAFKEIVFQISDHEKGFNPLYSKEKWRSVDIQRIGYSSEYQLCFSNQEYPKICFKAFPASGANSYKIDSLRAITLVQNYQNTKDSIRNHFSALRTKVQQKSAALNQQKALFVEQQIASGQAFGVQDSVLRYFTVDGFGVYNADYPCTLPNLVTLNLSLKSPSGTVLKSSNAYLADNISQNLFGVYVQKGVCSMSFNPDNPSMFWVTTNAKEVYFIPSSVLTTLSKTSGIQTVVLQSLPTAQFKKMKKEEMFNL